MRERMELMVRGLCALALVSTLLAGTAGSAAAAGSMSFADPASDGGAAPDITSVVVANDDQGAITFQLTIANRGALESEDTSGIPLATNEPDLTKGSRNDGANYAIGLRCHASVP